MRTMTDDISTPEIPAVTVDCLTLFSSEGRTEVVITADNQDVGLHLTPDQARELSEAANSLADEVESQDHPTPVEVTREVEV